MIDGAKSKNAIPIISSQTPGCPYLIKDLVVYGPTRWVDAASRVAVASNVAYVNHFEVSRQLSQGVALLINS